MVFWIQLQKMKASKILEHVRPETSGIVWISKQCLNTESPFLVELDYLCDGVITQRIGIEADKSDPLHVFFTSNFGKPLFIVFAYASSKSFDWKDMKKSLDICLAGDKQHTKETLILAESKEDFSPLLDKIKQSWKQLSVKTVTMTDN